MTERREQVGTEPESEPGQTPCRWTNVPPTVPGWYWTKDHHGTDRIEQVRETPEVPGQMAILENAWLGWRYRRVDVMGRMWAGPIPPPLPSRVEVGRKQEGACAAQV